MNFDRDWIGLEQVGQEAGQPATTNGNDNQAVDDDISKQLTALWMEQCESDNRSGKARV